MMFDYTWPIRTGMNGTLRVIRISESSGQDQVWSLMLMAGRSMIQSMLDQYEPG